MSGIQVWPLGVPTRPEQSGQEHNPTHQPGGTSSVKATTLLLLSPQHLRPTHHTEQKHSPFYTHVHAQPGILTGL